MDRAGAARAATVALVLLLAGCSGERADEPLPGVTLTGGPSAPATTGRAPAVPSGAPDRAALSAVAAAEEAVPGARAYSLDTDDEGYVVQVAAGGTTHEVVVAPDGSRVLLQSEDDDLDDDDRAALDAAEVAMAAAIRTALGGTGGTVEEAELERADGGVVWQVRLRTAGGEEDRLVDAVTGALR